MDGDYYLQVFCYLCGNKRQPGGSQRVGPIVLNPVLVCVRVHVVSK